MTNNRSNRNGRERQSTYGNYWTPSPTSESIKEVVSIDDIKNAMFMYDKKIHNEFIILQEKFLQFVGSKFGLSEQLLLEAGYVVVHGTRKPNHIETQSELDAFTFKQKETKKLQMKS